MKISPEQLLEMPLCDTVLRRAPVNLFLFDTDLVCRYAAPIHDEFMGRPRAELLGRHAAEVLPPAANGLGPVLQRAAHGAAAWQETQYRFTRHGDDADEPCCWSIQVEPVDVDDDHWVLVSCADALDTEEDLAGLRAQVETYQEQERARNAELISLLSDLRNLITPVSGYLQVIARRPQMMRERSPQSMIEQQVLPQLHLILDLVDRLRYPPIYGDGDERHVLDSA